MKNQTLMILAIALAAGLCVSCSKNEPLSPSDLSFQIRGYTYKGVVGEAGKVESVSGSLTALLCEGQEIELASTTIENGFIATKKYGKIRIEFDNSLTSGGFKVLLTNRQKQLLSSLKSTDKK